MEPKHGRYSTQSKKNENWDRSKRDAGGEDRFTYFPDQDCEK